VDPKLKRVAQQKASCVAGDTTSASAASGSQFERDQVSAA
jgi:hypothetical protein